MKNKSVFAKKNTTTSRAVRALRYCAVPFAAFFATQSASAATIVWSGTTDKVWATGTNWVGGTAPGTGDTATFNGAGNGNVNPIDLGAGGKTVSSIVFDSSAAAYTIGTGNTQTLTLNDGGSITVNPTVTTAQTINAMMTLGTTATNQDFTISNLTTTATTMVFGNTITISGNAAVGSFTSNLIFNSSLGNTISMFPSNSGNLGIKDGTNGGKVSLTKTGFGTLLLGNASSTETYTGGTYLNEGTLQVNAGNLPSNTSLFIAGGTTFTSHPANASIWTNIAQQWNGDFTLNGQNGTTVFSGGTVNLGATGTDTVRTVTGLGTPTVNSIISNGTNGTTIGLTKTGSGTMVLGGINTYTGTTTVNAGTLTITNTSTGGGAFAALGTGVLNVSGTLGTLNTSSAITIGGGNLTLTNTTTAEGSVNRIGNSTAITSNGGTLTYTNTSGSTYAENVGNVTLNGGQLNTVLSTNMAAGKQTLTFNSLTQNNRSTATFSQGTALNATSNVINVAGATATAGGQIIGPWATTGTSAIVQTDYAVYDAAGNIVAANIAGSLDSTWTDSTKAYTSNFLGGGAGNALSAVTHNMAALRNLPAFGNAATATTIVIPTGGNLNTYGLLNANTSTWTINQVTGSTGALSTPSGGGSIYINTGNGTGAGNGAITIGAPINDNGGAVSIVKTGTGNTVAVGQGVLTLSNVTSNFTGATVINGGAIVLNTSGALANGGLASSLGAASTSADNLVINGGFLQYGTATTAVSTNRLFSIGAMGGTIDSSSGTAAATMSFVGTGAMGFASQTGPRTLTLQGSNTGAAASTSGSNTSQSTIALLIGDNSGATSLNKAGAGTWVLSNPASTYTGPTTVTGGLLNVGTFAAVNTISSIGKGSATSSAADIILNGGGLQYSNNTAATTNRLFSVGTSNGTIDSSAASPGNTLSFTATGAMGFNNTTGARTLTLTGTNFGANSMGLRLDDFGGLTNLTKSANGTWVLANAGNTYTGVTTINNGILSVSKLANGGVASSIGASTNLPANLVMTADNGSFTAGNLGSLLSIVQPATSISLATVAPTLKYTGTGDSTDRTIKFTIANNDRAAVIDASGTGALNFTNANFTTSATTSFSTPARRLVLVLAGGNSADYTLANTISGIITDNTGESTSIVKTGLGTWVLAGNNSYGSVNQLDALFLGTIVNQGTLVLSGSPTGTGKTRVNAGGTLKLDYSTNDTSKLADATGILTLAGGTLNLSGGSHAEAVTSTTFSPGASSIIQSGGRTVAIHLNGLTRQAGSMVDFGSGTVADTDANNASSVGILGAYATIAGANWAKSVDAGAANTAITAYTTGYTDIDALGSTIANSANTNVRLNASAGTGNITLGAATTAINTLLQNTTTAATIDTTAKTLQTTGIMIADGKESLTIGLSAGTGSLQAATSGGDLVLNNASNYSGTNSGKTLTVNVPVILNGASTLTTAGNVTLNGVNTYTGATFVNSGTLTISGTGSLNSGTYNAAITIAQGATLNYTSSANQILGAATAGFGNFIWNPSNSTTKLTLSVDRGATPSVLTVKSGILIPSGGLTNIGSGPASDLVFDGGLLSFGEPASGNSYSTARLFTLGTGGATLQNGELSQIPATGSTRRAQFTATGAIAFTGSGARTLKFESGVALGNQFSPAIGDGPGGATRVIMGGTVGANGTWALDGANTYTGTTTVNGGNLVIRKQQSVNGGVAYFTTSNIDDVVSGASLAVGVGAAPTYFDSTAIATILDSSHLGASTATTGLNTGAKFGMDTTAGDFTYRGDLADLSGGNALNFVKHGINVLTLTGNNTYTGTTTISGDVGTSILRAGSSTAFGQASTASIVFGMGNFNAIQKLQLFGNNIAVIGLNSPNQGTSGTPTWRDGAGGYVIESGSSDTSGTGIDVLTVNTPISTTSTWSSGNSLNNGQAMIQDGGARKLGITKSGDGTLEIGTGTAGAGNTFNTYTGGTIINAGVLRLLNAGALGGASGTGGTVTFGPGTTTGKLQLNNNSITLVGLNTDAGTPGSAIVENGTAGSPTLTVNNATANTFAGVLQNGSAGTLLFTKSGAGTLTLSGNNTYTGNTTVSAGKLILSGNNVGAITGTTTVSGGVIQYNSLASINGTARNVTVTSPGAMVFGAALSDADIAAGLLRVVTGSTGSIAADNNAAGAFDFNTAGLTAASLGAVGNVTYIGTLTPNGGTYRLGGGGGTLTYPAAITGGTAPLTITGASTGSVVLSNNTNALGTLTVSSGVLDLNATTGQTATAITFAGGTVQNGTITGTSYGGSGGTVTASLGGAITFTNTANTTTLNANNSGFSGAVNVTGGTLRAVNAASLGTNTVTLNGGNLSLASDGTGTGLGNGKLENISYGNAVTVSANQSITVGQFTAAVGTLNAANKTLQLGALGITAQTLTVTNNNGFGLDFTGTTTLSGIPTFTVANPTLALGNAPIVQGLTLSGKVTGLFGIVKNGTGTLVLSNATNDFGIVAGGSFIDIINGLVSVSSDAQLGQALNQVKLNLSGSGLQLNPDGTGSFAHQINTTTAGGVIDVTQFGTTAPTTTNVATLTTAFNGAAASANAFSKNGNGILEISVANNGATPYTGVITVNAGAIRVSDAGALGATANNTVVSNNIGAAVQLNALALDTLTVAEPFSISNSGINTGGALQAIGGTLATPRSISTSGAIAIAAAATIGADQYTTLNIGTASMTGTAALTLAGAGNINISTALPALGSITKIGSGTAKLSAASPSYITALTVNAGTFKLDGTGTIGSAAVTNTVNPGATLTLDNATTNQNHRFGNGSTSARTLTLAGGTLNFIGNTTTETLGNLQTTGSVSTSAGFNQINLSGTGTNTLTFGNFSSGVNGHIWLFNIGSGNTLKINTSAGATDSNGIYFGNTANSGTRANRFFIGDGTSTLDFAQQDGSNNMVKWDYTSGGSFNTANADLGAVVNAGSAGNINIKPSGTQSTITVTNGGIATAKLTDGVGINLAAGAQLTINRALINLGGGNITGGSITSGGTIEFILNYATDGTISSALLDGGMNSFTKAGLGNLTLTGKSNIVRPHYLNQGTLTLAGGNNTLATNQAMMLNNGATLALGSNSQYLGSLTSTGLVEGSGGNVTGTGTLTTNATNGTFAGNLGSDGGALNFIKAGANTMTLVSAQSTTGTISIIGGGLTLKDGATLLGVPAVGGITINAATLTIDNSTGTKDMANRVKDTAAIALNSGNITYNGRAQFNSTETIGAVTANSGLNGIGATIGATGVNSATLTVASLTRNTGAMVAFLGTSGVGQLGNAARIIITSAPATVGGVIPGMFRINAFNDSPDMVGYVPGLGIGALGTAGFPAYYTSANGALSAASAADNVSFPSANIVASGGQTINSYRFSNQAITFLNPTDALKIASGMILQTGDSNNTIGTTAIRGQLTSTLNAGSGLSELFWYRGANNSGGASTINSVITDNGNPLSGGSRVMFVVSGGQLSGSNYTTILTANNTYTGGTTIGIGGVAAGPPMQLSATDPGATTIPAAFDPTKGLVINNSTVTMNTNAGQIAASNIVTLNGGSTLTLVGNNTLAGVVFNSNGGTATPTLAVGNILTVTGNITSTPTNVAVVPTISGTALDLNNTSHNITVDGGATTASLFHAGNGAAVTGLTISSAINSTIPASGSITKLGTGVLELITGANTFTGGLNINAGALKASSASALGGSGNVATLNNNAAIWLNATVNGGQTIVVSASGGTIASLGDNTLADNITLNGPLTISLADPTLNNTDRQITYSTAITGTGGLTVIGNVNNPFNATPKPLLLTNATSGTNTFSGGLTIGSGGRVKPTATFNIGSLTGSLTVNTGGVLDMNAKDQMVGNFTGTGGQVLGGTAVLTIGNGNGTGGNYAGVISTGISLVKIGTGTITLSGANTYTGSTSANGGTLALNFASAGAPLTNIITASSALSLGGGTLSVQGKSSVTNTQAFASTTATSNSTLTLAQNTATSLDVNLAALSFTGGAGINFTGATGTTVGARFITSNTAGSNDGLTRLGGGSMWNGTGWASITDSGGTKYVTAWAGSYNDLYTGTTGGSVVVPNTATAEARIQEGGSTGSPNTLAAATTTINSLLMSAATTASTIKMNAIGANDTLVVGNGASAAGAIAVASGAKGLTIGESANQGFLTAGSSGASTLALNTQNALAADGIVVNSKITNNAGSGVVSISAGGAGGTVTLNGANTYTGTTAIGNGTLEIGGAGSLGSGSYAQNISIGGGGTLKYNSSAPQTLSGIISGAGSLYKDANSTLNIGSLHHTFSGGTTINNGTLVVADGGYLPGTATINTNGTLEITNVISGVDGLKVININGGTLKNNTGGQSDFYTTTVNMTGGTWMNTQAAGRYDLLSSLGNGGVTGVNENVINTFASANTALISATLGLRGNNTAMNLLVTVADGAAATDLEVSGLIRDNSAGSSMTKAGPGLMAFTGNQTIAVGGIIGYSGATTISGGTLSLGKGTATGNLNPASAIVNNGTLAFNRTNALVQGTDFNSVISGTGGVSQLGSGTTTLSGFNTYTGATAVSAGTLLVSGSISGSAVTVSGTGTLGSSSGTTGGTVGSVNVTSGGTLAPGASTGILTSTGNLTMSSGSTFAAEVNATGVGTGYDQMVVAGNVNLGGSTLSLSGSYNLGSTGDVFTLILNNGSNAVTGTFTGLSNGGAAFLGGQEFQISYFDIASTPGLELTGGNDVSLLAVPEPGAAVSLLGGLGLLLGIRRRRRA